MENLSVKATADVSNATKGLKEVKTGLQEVAKQAAVTGNAMGSELQKGTTGATSSLKGLADAATNGGGLQAIGNQIGPLIQDFKGLQEATGSGKEALLSMIGAGIGIAAVTAVTALAVLSFKYLTQENKYLRQSVEQTKEETEKYGKALKEITESSSVEQAHVLTLVTALNSQTLTRKEQIGTLKELQGISQKYFGDLKVENGLIDGLTAAYTRYKDAIIASIQNKLDEKKLTDVLDKINTIEQKRVTNGLRLKQIDQERRELQDKGATPGQIQQLDLTKQLIGQEDGLNRLYTIRDGILKNISARHFEGQTVTGTDKPKKDVETIADVLAKLGREIDFLNTKQLTFHVDETKPKIQAIESTIETLIGKFKQGADSPYVINLIAEMGTLKDEKFLRDFAVQARRLRKDINVAPAADIAINLEGSGKFNPFKNSDPFVEVGNTADAQMKKMIDSLHFNNVKTGIQDGLKTAVEGLRFPELSALYQDTQQKVIAFADFASGEIADTVGQSFALLGRSIGEGLAGAENPIGAFFGGIAGLLAKSLKTLGEYIIMTSSLIASIKKSLNDAFAGNPALGIAVGVGLIIVGSALEASIPKFAGGVQNFGGGSAVVGEMGPEILQLPKGSNIIPNHRAGSISGGQSNVFIADVVLSGNDLRLVFGRAEAASLRNGGN